MEHNSYEMDKVMEYWNDITQDIRLISQELEIPENKVREILTQLQTENKIENFEILESVDPETGNILKLKHFGPEYTFSKRNVNKLYDALIFDIEVKTMEADNESVVFDCEVNYKNRKYPFLMVYDTQEQVFYGSREGKETVRELMDALGENEERFHQTTLKIINELLPEDYWEGKNKQN